MTLTLESPDFRPGAALPARFTCDGQDISPALRWQGLPAETKSLALVLADPDAPRGTFYHWAIFDLSPELDGLPAGVAADARIGQARQGVNDFNRLGYSGSCPPKGDRPHHYHFRLFALKVASLDLRDRVKAAEVEVRAREQALTFAELIGTYAR